MIYLVLSVLCTSFLFVIFKLFDVYKVQTLYAIVVNYVVACTVGLLISDNEFNFAEIVQKSWFFGAIALGIFFILVFNLMAKTAQVAGVSVASVATKMSLVIPVVLGGGPLSRKVIRSSDCRDISSVGSRLLRFHEK